MGREGVRVARVGDADEIARLLHDFNTEYAVPSPGPVVVAARLRRLLAAESTFAVIAGQPAVAVGLVTLRPNVWYDGSVALLDELYVVPGRRGGGIGGAVMEAVLDAASDRGAVAIEINVDEGDVDALRFYDRHGFSMVDPDTNERALFLFRELGPLRP